MGISTRDRILSFETGIEQVMASIPQEEVNLPQVDRPLIPSEEQLDHHLEMLFNMKGLDDICLERLRPELRNKDLLIPANYKSTLTKAARDLRQALSRNDGPKQHREDLDKAAGLLDKERELLELLTMFRNILIKA